MFTYPPGSPDIHEKRIVNMFTKMCIMDKIFSSESSPLRVVTATSAFGIGIDVFIIRTIIHLGCCEGVESYIQAVGWAGCDGNPSKAAEEGWQQHINKCKRTVWAVVIAGTQVSFMTMTRAMSYLKIHVNVVMYVQITINVVTVMYTYLVHCIFKSYCQELIVSSI